MTVTIRDVALRAGVSKTTVSRVLNGRGELDERTAERVRAVIDELGYVPSARAVAFARGSTRVVAMLLPSLAWPWMGEVLQAAVEVVEDEGYGMLVFTTTQGDESMRRFGAHVSARAFDGLLVVEPEGQLDYIAQLHDQGLPVVLIDDRGHEPRFPSVTTTNRVGALAAAQHLLSLGRRRPLVVTGEPRFGCIGERLAGFADGYRAAGVELDPALRVEGDFTYESGQAAAVRALEAGLEFDSLFAHNDVMAAGAMTVLRHAGLRVPDDVAVVGFDDLPAAAQCDPPLTAVHQPIREMGATAARMLLANFAGDPLPSAPTVLPTSFTVRASTAG
ncbi:LacI family transcriptional regulator [Cellulomonas sp. DKR-3]|uniref:LacI family transcriptional regulator n=1 Tax=Cellulomonas fulva TaxID=2835530 RepID=A0ABS5U284_9CELL|nr:LacI family DNA-binding transcriptional regulator [Cellulomonas fulva]MBT0995503.1 LacI family transcriptional regulator [Cellulomonas fulva]